jgi:hypothetical protein
MKLCIHLLRYPLHQPQAQTQKLGNGMPPMFPRPQAGMWPQLPPHQQLADEQSEKQREYLKQQQKLRLMTTTSTAVCILFFILHDFCE